LAGKCKINPLSKMRKVDFIFLIGLLTATVLSVVSIIEVRRLKNAPLTGNTITREIIREVERPEQEAGSPEQSPAEKAVPVVATQTPVAPASPPKQQITFIPVSGGISTTSTDWVDVPGSEFELNLQDDFGKTSSVTWEASIYEQHGNGRAIVRLSDKTNSVAVPGSEVSTNSDTSTLIKSDQLVIWAGKNKYQVQIKSEKSFPAFFDSGRVKIVY